MSRAAPNLATPELAALLARAREVSWVNHGKKLTVATPGMFMVYGRKGRYPAVSLTGKACELNCDHCAGRLLETMLPAESPDELIALGRKLKGQGQHGFLLSGGSDQEGRLPWQKILPAIERVIQETGLTVTAHVARIDAATASALKNAGVRQALIDVVGAEETACQVLHLSDGLQAQEETMSALAEAGLEVVPHIILGLHKGRMLGEERALSLVAGLNTKRVVLVVLMPLKHTPFEGLEPPAVEDAARFMALARDILPTQAHHLGCARPRGRYRAGLDALAVEAGINVLAIPSDAALDKARELGVEISHADTCCSLV
jgi:uncharacterized radical SAM superfamily protein